MSCVLRPTGISSTNTDTDSNGGMHRPYDTHTYKLNVDRQPRENKKQKLCETLETRAVREICRQIAGIL